MTASTPKATQRPPHPVQPEKVPDRDFQYGLGTEIANLFAGIGLRPGEEIKEWKGFPVKDPFNS